MRIILEGTTAFLTLEFRDVCGDPEPPSSASYRIDNITTGSEIRPDTPIQIPPSGRYTIKLTSTDNAIVNEENIAEVRRVTVIGIYNLDEDEVPGVYDYTVKRIEVPNAA